MDQKQGAKAKAAVAARSVALATTERAAPREVEGFADDRELALDRGRPLRSGPGTDRPVHGIWPFWAPVAGDAT